MKTSIDPAYTTFQPVNFTITIETKEELRILRAIYGIYIILAGDIIQNASYMDNIPEEDVEEVLKTTFKPLDELALERGLLVG